MFARKKYETERLQFEIGKKEKIHKIEQTKSIIDKNFSAVRDPLKLHTQDLTGIPILMIS